MSILSQLKSKPWLITTQGQFEGLRSGHQDDPYNGEGGWYRPKEKFGLCLFLGVITSLFLVLVNAYVMRRGLEDWRPLPELWLLWLNTGMLILSSIGLQGARVAARRGQITGVRDGLLFGGVFAWAFLAGQLWAWQQLSDLGYFAATNPANTFFYLVTALHGLHLLGGLMAWGKTTAKVLRGFDITQVRLSVELCGIYFHFLLVVWLVFFGLMLFK